MNKNKRYDKSVPFEKTRTWSKTWHLTLKLVPTLTTDQTLLPVELRGYWRLSALIRLISTILSPHLQPPSRLSLHITFRTLSPCVYILWTKTSNASIPTVEKQIISQSLSGSNMQEVSWVWRLVVFLVMDDWWCQLQWM